MLLGICIQRIKNPAAVCTLSYLWSNYNDIVTAASAHSGMAINYQPYNDALPAYLMPATILAATDYDKVNGTVNYMYQLFPNQAVTVDTNALSKTFIVLTVETFLSILYEVSGIFNGLSNTAATSRAKPKID